MRQPRVISEVIAGVILGPSILGRIPNFSNTIFPPESLPYLTLTANIGLVLFLFLVGLETDTRVIRRNAKYSVFVAAGGMILPFSMGVGVASLVYKKFVDHDEVTFGNFLLFVGVAFAVSLVNASSNLTALWVLLATTAFTIFILVPIRYGFLWLARRTGSLEDGQPSTFLMTVILLLVFCSAFCTDVLGVHPIFGGFLAGLVIPQESGFAIALTEKLEDLVSLLFLPLYFTLSGLKTDLGLLNNGTTWGYTILITIVAFIGKFIGASVPSKWLGFNWREAGAIGILMSCKGLVELIVLNIGLQAGILSPRVFAMFVIEALTLTFITTPLTLLVYPPKYRTFHSTAKHKPDEESRRNIETSRGIAVPGETDLVDFKRRIAVVLHRLEHISPLMTMTQLLGVTKLSNGSPSISKEMRDVDSPSTSKSPPKSGSQETLSIGPTLDALRLMDLSDRTSAVMYGSVTSELLRRDPLVAALRTFARIHGIPMTTASLAVIPYEDFPSKISERATESGADLVLLSWNTTLHPVAEALPPTKTGETPTYNPFEGMFGKSTGGVQVRAPTERSAAVIYAQFVRKVFSLSAVDVALYIESDSMEVEQHKEEEEKPDVVVSGQKIFMPFFGGPDDRLALNLIVQICANSGGLIEATVVKITKTEPDVSLTTTKDNNEAVNTLTVQSATGFPETIYGPENTHMRMESETADNLLWNGLAKRSADMAPLSPDVRRALGHITFIESSTPTPLAFCIDQITQVSKDEKDVGVTRGVRRNVMAVVGRGRRLAVEDHHAELKAILSSGANASSRAHVGADARNTLGDVGAAFLVGGPSDISMLILQTAHASNDV
ncbi:K(+)/H(+) antiporter [Serendipita sp. 411]|nr:K(+)/H(+) antiporter [Serendipita sp. 411]